MENEIMQLPEEAGRSTDTQLGHLSLGEIVIPRAFLDDPEFMQMLQLFFQQNGADINEFTVGHAANKINPETGYPEFFSFKSFLKFAAPIALSLLAPGIGTALGSTLSASTLGGIGGAIGGGLAGGGLKGVALGGLGGYAMNGGLAGLGSKTLGTLPGGALQGPTVSGATLTGTGSGSGILGALGRTTGLSASGGGSTFTGGLGSTLAKGIAGFMDDSALKKAQEQLLAGNQQQLANLESFDPSGITSDPGYQFNLEQGQKGLNNGLAAGGNLFSGRALKATSEYNQNYADNAFNNYYSRWLEKMGGQNAIYGSNANTMATTGIARSNNLGSALSSILNPQPGISQEQLLKMLGA